MKKIIVVLVLFISIGGFSQEMGFEEYNPVSTLVVSEHLVERAKFPFIDIHSHQWNVTKEKVASLKAEMDEINMQVMVNLSGRGWSRDPNYDGTDYLAGMVKRFNGEAPGRFIVFTNIDFKKFGEDGWIKKALKNLETDVQNGANGLKIYKSLGLRNVDINGNRIPIDHP